VGGHRATGGYRVFPVAATGTATGTPIPTNISAADAQRGFSRSIVVSAIRCTLTYVVLPFVTPLIGLAPGVGPAVGLAVGTVAITANVLSIRRFWRADHRWKRPVTVLHSGVIVLLSILLYLDASQLVT
jgi:hypothetical protein